MPAETITLLKDIGYALALLLAGIGVYGAISCSATERSHEIGIRMALGAGNRQVLGMVVGQGMRLAAAGIAIGLGGALAIAQLLSSMLLGVTARDPPTFVMVAAVLASVARSPGRDLPPAGTAPPTVTTVFRASTSKGDSELK